MKKPVFKEDLRNIPMEPDRNRSATEWYMETCIQRKSNQLIRNLNELQAYLEKVVNMAIVFTAINTIATLILLVRRCKSIHHIR